MEIIGEKRNKRMKKTVAVIIIVIALIAIVAVITLLPGCSEKMESITVAHAQFESTALFCIAEDRQFFRQNGLNVTSRKFDTGVGALDGMLKGEADIAVGTSEFPLVKRAFQKKRIGTIGSIDKIQFIYLIGRKDRGIEKISDLKGKRIGTTSGTIAEFYLGRFLGLHGMNMQDITFIDIKTPAEYQNAIANGDVDAVVTAQPNANSIKDRLGHNADVWPAQSDQPQYALMISTDEWITKHPELVSRFLKSLAQAEEYALRNPAEAKAIVQKRLNLDAAYMETVWSQNQFSLSLDQSLILAMEDEARWMVSNNLTGEKKTPDFSSYIYADGLKSVKPEAVNIIR